MADERSAEIILGGKKYEMILTTRATKEIAARYGGLGNLGEKIMSSENIEMQLEEVVWVITLLVNQSILIHNLEHKDDPKEPITEEMVELLTTPFDMGLYQTAIAEALNKGVKRNVESEDEQKNAETG